MRVARTDFLFVPVLLVCLVPLGKKCVVGGAVTGLRERGLFAHYWDHRISGVLSGVYSGCEPQQVRRAAEIIVTEQSAQRPREFVLNRTIYAHLAVKPLTS